MLEVSLRQVCLDSLFSDLRPQRPAVVALVSGEGGQAEPGSRKQFLQSWDVVGSALGQVVAQWQPCLVRD